MKIKSVELDGIRCFEKLKLDFTTEQGSKDWILILGDNGVGKTTILRSIALGLTEESGASGLLDELGSDWIRKGFKNESQIKIEIEPFPGCTEYASIVTQFTEDKFHEIKVRQKVNPTTPKTFNWDNLFVCGYGAGRGIGYTESYQDYIITDSIYTLFKYTHPLQNPELNIRRINSIGISEREIFSRIEKILMLNDESIFLDFDGLKVSGPWGQKMPLDALGDGYQSTFGWVMDLFGWKALFEGKQKVIDKERINTMSGIVLLDEIEQHLHPKWQKKIVKLLNEQFPNIQFIVTTHSPLSVVGSTDLDDKQCSIIVLEQAEEQVTNFISTPPRGKRVDQVLTSYMFDLCTTSDNKIKQDIERYNFLYSIHRNDAEEKEIQDLYVHLNQTLGSAETELEKLVENAVQKTLEQLTKEQLDKQKSPNPSQFEIRRQLETLFK